MVSQYDYKTLGGLISINTLSPNKEYYYQISKPKSLNPSAWGVEIAFFNLYNTLHYYKKGLIANELPRKESQYYTENRLHKSPETSGTHSIEFVRWSENGNIAYLFENKFSIDYYHVFIHLKEMREFRIVYNREYDFFVPPNFSLDFFNEIISRNDYHSEIIVNDKMSKGFLFNKWYPKVKK